jgi:hypothetical protein
MLKNEYRPVTDRKHPTDMTLPELVREFAALKTWFAVNEVARRAPGGKVRHLRLGLVVDQLRHRGALD